MKKTEITLYSSELKKNDIILFGRETTRMLIVDVKDGGVFQETTAYPYPESKYRIVNFVRYYWIYICYYASIIKIWTKKPS